MTDMTMKERIARALYEAIAADDTVYLGDLDDGSLVTVDGFVDFNALAEAVLDAIREPDTAMIKVGTDKMPSYRELDDRDQKYFLEWYAAVIDAAKTEGAT